MEPKADADLLNFFMSFLTNDGIWSEGRKEGSSPPGDLFLVNFRPDALCEMVMFFFSVFWTFSISKRDFLFFMNGCFEQSFLVSSNS